MNEPIINGIDVSECPHYDKVAGCFHTLDGKCIKDKCSIYKLILKNQCLQEENKELRQIRKNSPDIQEPYIYLYRQIKKQCHKLEEENKRLQMLSCANCGEKYLSPEGAELYEKNVQLQEENEKLKEKNAILILANSGIEEKNEQLNERVKTFTKPKYYYKGLQKTEEEKDKYKQALEKIKKWATNHNPCDIEAGINCTKEDCFKCLNYDITKITEIINEVLSDRD